MKKILIPILVSLVVSSSLTWATPIANVDYVKLVKKTKSSVVFITTTQSKVDDKGSSEDVTGQGSGIVYDGLNGYILTNAHVIKDADDIQVTLADKTKLKAKVIGADERTDIAVLQIQSKPLSAVTIGNAATIEVGEPIAVIGAPYGLEMTVTAGIISAKHRDLEGQFTPFIQTDAAVNPGNSGGPLFNSTGQVIGINSQIYTHTGSFAGLSFAIPIDIAVDSAKQLIATGKVNRSKLGVLLQPMSADIAEVFGLKKETGALITAVQEKSPAADAGLLPGDILLKADGIEITDYIDIPRYVSKIHPGQTVQFEIWRKSAIKTITSEVALIDDDSLVAKASKQEESPLEKLGIRARPLNSFELEQASVKEGLSLDQIREKSAAAKAGLKAGDAILAIKEKSVATIQELQDSLPGPGEKTVLLTLRDGLRRYIVLTVNKED